MKRMRTLLSTVFWSLLPQALTLLSMLMPIFFGLGPELVSLVLISGIATIAVHPATLGCLSVFAAVRSPRKAATTMAASILCLVCVASLLAASGLLALVLNNKTLSDIISFSSLVLMCQGAYFLVLSYATRAGTYQAIVKIRLVYGTLSFILMYLASTVWLYDYSLPLAAAVSFGGAALVAVVSLRREIPWRYLTNVDTLSVFRRIWELRETAAVFTLAGISGQSSSLALAVLGPLAVPFATVTRLANGFQTLGAQVVAPKFDIDYASALRARNANLTSRIYNRAFFWGLGLAVMGITTAIAVVVSTDEFTALSVDERCVLYFAIVMFWGSQIAASVVGKFLTFAGFSGVRLWNEFARAIPLVCILVFLRDSQLLVWLSLVMAVSMGVFIYLGKRHSKLAG